MHGNTVTRAFAAWDGSVLTLISHASSVTVPAIIITRLGGADQLSLRRLLFLSSDHSHRNNIDLPAWYIKHPRVYSYSP